MVIVTGAAGFIASNLLADCEARDVGPLVAVDWLGEGGKWMNLRQRELAGIIQPSDLFAFLAKTRGCIRAIFHIRAISTTSGPNVDLLLQHSINYAMRRIARP
jgi:ADP-L-glycero-D-manno-heptose 6-epimerase